MNEMIERVARAMAEADVHNTAWKLYVREARAAIEAMREPTEEMFVAAYAVNGGKWTDDEYEPPPKICWSAMIDAALKPHPSDHSKGAM